MAKETVKSAPYCGRCRYYITEDDRRFFNVLDACDHPAIEDRHPITGRRLPAHCTHMRSASGQRGPDGKLFDSRHVMITRASRFVRKVKSHWLWVALFFAIWVAITAFSYAVHNAPSSGCFR